MSGSGGGRSNRSGSHGGSFGGSGSGFPPGARAPEACEALVQEAYLNSPKAAVINQLRPDDRLAVALETLPSGHIVVARTSQGAVAGSLTHPGYESLIACMESGYRFEAVVVSVAGGLVQVRITGADR